MNSPSSTLRERLSEEQLRRALIYVGRMLGSSSDLAMDLEVLEMPERGQDGARSLKDLRAPGSKFRRSGAWNLYRHPVPNRDR